jgi:hypothetical protein
MDRIVEFYSGHTPDHRGRWLHDIQQWQDDRLEDVHDFIQWLFPLREPSPVNPEAPTISAHTIEAFREDPGLQSALRVSFERMLRFYGFDWHDGRPPRIEPRADFPKQSANWLTPGNHNHLRITRILKCLMLLHLVPEAHAFFAALAELNAKERESRAPRITPRTFEFWQSAVAGTNENGEPKLPARRN